MEKIEKFIKDVLWVCGFVLIFGIVGGLGLFMTIAFTYYAFFWALLVTGFFSIFHLSDLKDFIVSRNFLAFFGRLICLYSLSSAISGYVALMSGLLAIDLNQFDSIVLLGSIIVSYILVTFWAIMITFFSHTTFYKNFRQIIEGLYALGILWRY